LEEASRFFRSLYRPSFNQSPLLAFSARLSRQPLFGNPRQSHFIQRFRQLLRNHLQVIAHYRQRHGRAHAMPIPCRHRHQKLPVTPALPPKHTLPKNRRDKGPSIRARHPLLIRRLLSALPLPRLRLRLNAKDKTCPHRSFWQQAAGKPAPLPAGCSTSCSIQCCDNFRRVQYAKIPWHFLPFP